MPRKMRILGELNLEEAVESKIPARATVDDTGLVTYKNAAGVTLFTLDLAGLGGNVFFGNVVISAESIEVTEGGTGTFTVCLETAPSVNQPVYLAVSDATRLSISPSTLTFTPDNYATEQTVTVTALQDEDEDDDSVTVTLTSRKVDARQVVVDVVDDDRYVLFGGKDVVSMILASSFIYGDSTTTYTDSATGEEITATAANYSPFPFKVLTNPGDSTVSLATKAREKLEANTTGAYSIVFAGNNVTVNTVGSVLFTGIVPYIICYYGPKGWKSLKINLTSMYYNTVSGELSTASIPGTDLETTTDDLPGWDQHVVAFSFNVDGSITGIIDGIEVYKSDPPEDFASWNWNLDGWSWDLLRYVAIGDYGNFFVNDSLTADDITEFYTRYLAPNFT